MSTLFRSAKVKVEVLQGEDILRRGHEIAQRLWNYTRWCVIGYNEKLRIERGDSWEVFKRNQAYSRTGEGYPGKFKLEKELRDYWAAKDLSDRCFIYTVRDFDIAMQAWFSSVKSNPQARPPKYTHKPRLLTFGVGRNAKKIDNWTYQLSVLGGYIPDRHAIVKLHVPNGIKMGQVKIIRLQPDGTGTVDYCINQVITPCYGVAGIDLGIINIATVAFESGESILYSGKAILDSDRYYHKHLKSCKPSDWTKGKTASRQSQRSIMYWQKAASTRRLAIHNLTRNIIDECVKRGVRTIVLGDLKGITEGKYFGNVINQQLHAWPFDEIKRQVTYKAEEVGIEVTLVSERNTSKCCHICGQVGQRKPRGLLTCRDCGIVINSDVNGAFNILNKVSPAPAYAGVGVGAVLPGSPSLLPESRNRQSVKALSQISPTFVAKFERNWSITQTRCDG